MGKDKKGGSVVAESVEPQGVVDEQFDERELRILERIERGLKIVVHWTPPPRTCRCVDPRCRSENTKIVKTDGGIRSHRCRACGLKWDSTAP